MPQSATREALTWLTAYFILSLTLTIYNKAVLQFYAFPYPWLLTAIHTGCGWIGCLILSANNFFTKTRLNDAQRRTVAWFSVLYTVNIAASNVSLNLVTVPFHQVARALVPVFTIVFSIILFGDRYSSKTFISLIPVVVGVPLATFGDYYFTTLGFVVTFLGTALASVKTIVTNKVQVGEFKLHPLDLLLHMSPLSMLQTLICATAVGEVSSFWALLNGVGDGNAVETVAVIGDKIATPSTSVVSDTFTTGCLIALLGNGIIAFLLNYVSFTANGKTSPLMMCVAGNMKQVMSIILSVLIFSLKVNWINGIGIILTLVGGAWYAVIEMERKKLSSATKAGPSGGILGGGGGSGGEVKYSKA